MKTFETPDASLGKRPSQNLLGLHRWIGRVLMLYLLVIFASGTLLVLGSELESLIAPQMQRRAAEGPIVAPQSFGAWLDAAQTSNPAAKPLIIRAPQSGWFAAEVEMRQNGTDFIVWIDPAKAEVQGQTPVLGLKEIVRRFHVSLLIEGRFALMLTSAISLVLFVQIILGLSSLRRFWRGFIRWPGLRPNERTAWGNWHRWAGLWSMPTLMVTCLTGVFYFSETLGFTPDLPAAAASFERTGLLPPGFNGDTLDQAVSVAMSQMPGLDIREIYFPLTNTDGITIRGDLEANLVRPRANAVTLDPVTLMPLGSFRGEDLSLGRRLTEAADLLHFGTFGGVTTRIIWVISGILAISLAVSGLKIASWRVSSVPGQPSFLDAVRAIYLPARVLLAAAVAVVGVTALRMGF